MYRLVTRAARPAQATLLVYPRAFYTGPHRAAVMASLEKFKKNDPAFEK